MRHLFLAFLFSMLFNQDGFIRLNGFYPLMDKAGGEGGGGAGDDENEDEDDNSKEKPGASDKNKSKKPGASDDEEEEEEDEDQESELSKLPDDAQKLIKKLRKENQKLRSKSKNSDERIGKIEKALKLLSGDEDDDEAPEAKLSKVSARNEELEVRAAYQEMALEHEIPKAKFKYFSFLMNEAVSELEDDEELSEEQFEEILTQVKAQDGGKANNTTSVNGKQGGGKAPKKGDQVTAEEFKKMGIIARSKLFQTNPELYSSLLNEVGV